jgi:hypothetical protein
LPLAWFHYRPYRGPSLSYRNALEIYTSRRPISCTRSSRGLLRLVAHARRLRPPTRRARKPHGQSEFKRRKRRSVKRPCTDQSPVFHAVGNQMNGLCSWPLDEIHVSPLPRSFAVTNPIPLLPPVIIVTFPATYYFRPSDEVLLVPNFNLHFIRPFCRWIGGGSRFIANKNSSYS